MAHARCPHCKFVSDFVVNDEEELRRRERYREDEDGYLRVDLCRVCGFGGIERSEDQGGYFSRELPGIAEEWPRMGRLCEHCNRRIPRFLDLDSNTERRARDLARQHHMIDAIKMIREATGCRNYWAQLWAEHPDGPRPLLQRPGPPCVYCGEPLASPEAKQCLECGMDWHDPDNIRKLGA
jgi:hypothetical protein